MRAGLATTRWPGRLDVVSEKPLIMLDGAHNLDAAKQLARHLRANFKDRDITLVVGILDDKALCGMLKLLLPYAARVIATQAKTSRALPAEKLEAVAKTLVSGVRIIRDVRRGPRPRHENRAPAKPHLGGRFPLRGGRSQGGA